MSAPKISIILPTYNSARTLSSCLSSLAENLRDFEAHEVEIVAPMRRSVDDTEKILQTFLRCRIVPHNEVGISPAYNLGVANATGEYSLFLNSDDELGPGYLQAMWSEVERMGKGAHVVYSTVSFIDVNGQVLYRRHPAPYFGFIQKYYSIILHPNALYPTELLRKYPFEVLPGAPPRDREQVHALMKEATWSRLQAVEYRYRIWSSSGTVQRAKTRSRGGITARIVTLLGRVLVQAYETNLWERILNRRTGGASYWQRPVT